MTTRFKTALMIQGGASNRRLVSRKLHEAIVECQDEGKSTEDCPAIFLICHQMTFLLTGHDFALSGEHMINRWTDATRQCEELSQPAG